MHQDQGFSIPKHHSAKIDVSYEFAVKNTDGWNANAQAMFRAGFAFKSTTNVHLDVPIGSNTSGNYTGNQAAGLIGAGQQVTAVGGFVFDTQREWSRRQDGQALQHGSHRLLRRRGRQ